MQTQKQLLCLQQRKPLKILPIPLNQTKIKRTEKIPKIKRTSKDNSQNSNGSAVEKSEKSEQSSSNSSSDKKKPSSSSNSSSKPNKKNDVQPTTQDKYKTDPVPSGKPKPVEPEEQETKDTNLLLYLYNHLFNNS